MLYLVECQKKGSSDSEYMSPFPEGIEAESSKEAMFSVMRTMGGTINKNQVTSNGVTYFNFHAKPKKWENYKTPMSCDDRVQAFEDELMNAFRSRDLEPEPCINGIRVKTGVDTWIIQACDVHDIDAQVTVFHKNNWNANNDSTGSIPGFHKQASGRFSVKSLVNFVMNHENKWKAKGRRNIVHHAANRRY